MAFGQAAVVMMRSRRFSARWPGATRTAGGSLTPIWRQHFDRIDHDYLMGWLGTFPARGRIGQWLTAGVIEHGWFTPTVEGTPQGGVISPLMMNVALHGLETAAGVGYFPDGRKDAGRSVPGSPVVVRYADDLVALCVSAEQAQQVKDSLARWLARPGAWPSTRTRRASSASKTASISSGSASAATATENC